MYDILLYITFFLGLFPIFFYSLFKINRRIDQRLKPIVPFLLLAAVAALYEPIFTIGFGFNSLYWFRAYNVLEFICLLYFFAILLGRKYLILYIFFSLVFVAGSIGIVIMDIGQLIVESLYSPFIFLFVTISSALWFAELISHSPVNDLTKNPVLTFVIGFILYYSATLFFYLMSEVIVGQSNIMCYKKYWLINVLSTLVFKIILIIGVWNGRKT